MDGSAEEPFLEPSRDSVPAVADLLRLRRRRAERLVPVPVPPAAAREPFVDAALSRASAVLSLVSEEAAEPLRWPP